MSELDRIGTVVERYAGLDGDSNQCQPCTRYLFEAEGHWGRSEHQCPLCEGWRSFCHTCFKDHHLGGWNSCNHDYTQNTTNSCPRNHPLCVKYD